MDRSALGRMAGGAYRWARYPFELAVWRFGRRPSPPLLLAINVFVAASRRFGCGRSSSCRRSNYATLNQLPVLQMQDAPRAGSQPGIVRHDDEAGADVGIEFQHEIEHARPPSGGRGCRSARRRARRPAASPARARWPRAGVRRRTVRPADAPGACPDRRAPASPPRAPRLRASACAGSAAAWRRSPARRIRRAGGGTGRRSRGSRCASRPRSASSTLDRSRPSNSTVPAVGSSRPPSRCSSVLLPEPLAPTMATRSPRRDVEVDAQQHRHFDVALAEYLLQPAAAERRSSLIAQRLRRIDARRAPARIQRREQRQHEGDAGDDGDIAPLQVGRQFGDVIDVLGQELDAEARARWPAPRRRC